MNNFKLKHVILSALIGALYVAVTISFAEISYGQIQFRISEFLTVLPLFSIAAIPGVTLGCLISNIYGVLYGNTMVPDVFFGTIATLIAGITTYFIGKTKKKKIKMMFGPMPAVIANAIIVGIELTLFYEGTLFLNMLFVGIGEIVVCYGLGVPLIAALHKNDIYKKIFN